MSLDRDPEEEREAFEREPQELRDSGDPETQHGGHEEEPNAVRYLNELKRKCNLSLRKIADNAGLSSGQVNQWFHGNQPLPITDSLLKLAKALNVGEEVLLRVALIDLAERKARNCKAVRVAALVKKMLQPNAAIGDGMQYFVLEIMCRNKRGILGSLGSFLGARDFDIHSISQVVLQDSGMAKVFTVVRNTGENRWSAGDMKEAVERALLGTEDLDVSVVDLYDVRGS